MGAHTLGGGMPQHSGHDGVFVEGERNMFNNNYYKIILDKEVDWGQVNSCKLLIIKTVNLILRHTLMLSAQVISLGTNDNPVTKWRWDGYRVSDEKVRD